MEFQVRKRRLPFLGGWQADGMGGVLLWDFDGTLAARPRMWASACVEALRSLDARIDIAVDELDRRLGQGMPWHRPGCAYPDLDTPERWWRAVRERIETVLVAEGCSPAEASAVAVDVQVRIRDAAGYSVFPDVWEALDLAEGAGWRSAVVSNHIPELSAVLDGLGLLSRMSWVLSSGSVGFEKPHPAIFAMAIELVDGHDSWMIGDSLDADCAGARAAGIPAVHVRATTSTHEPHAPDAAAAVRWILERES